MRKFTFFISMLAVTAVFLGVLPFATAAFGTETSAPREYFDEGESYQITFTRGYTFINPLTGAEADHLFSGTIPAAIPVLPGESFVFPENTVKFYDYVFVGWVYKYKDENGKTVTETYLPGEIYEGVEKEMTFDAAWKRPDSPGLVITGFISFFKGDPQAEGDGIVPYPVTFGKKIKLPACPYAKDGYVFAGWLFTDGVLYRENAEYTVGAANPAFTAVWARDGEQPLTHKVTYSGGEGEITGNAPETVEIYKKNHFKVAENTFVREGFVFLHWEDEEGGVYLPGDEVSIEDTQKTETALRAVWKESARYFDVEFTVVGLGGISPAYLTEGAQKVAEGESLEFTAVPSSGYLIKALYINGEEKEAVFPLKIENIKENLTVTVVFEEIPTYSVRVIHNEGGEAYADMETLAVQSGGNISVRVNPYDGYRVMAVYINGKAAAYDGGVVGIRNITEDISVEVVFVKDAASSESSAAVSEHSEIPIVPTGEAKYIALFAALLALLTLGFIVFRFKK